MRPAGTRLGAYRIDALLGEGAMGEVYRGVHEKLGRQVAIKMLKPAVAADGAHLDRFFAEARAVNLIRHENIVECTDMVRDGDAESYIVMELLEGRTLRKAIEEAGRIPSRRAARIAAQISDAIGAAHDCGVVHRDLKPDNVFLIRRAGSNDYVKVLDFGIARLRPEMGAITATESGALIGTPAYMSPEQVRGEKVGPASDIYALGAVLFEMLSGRMPFQATTVGTVLLAHLQEMPPCLEELVPDLPSALVDCVAKALAKAPSDRFPSMAAFRETLLSAVGLPVEVNASIATSPRPGRPARELDSGSSASVSSPALGSASGKENVPFGMADTVPAGVRPGRSPSRALGTMGAVGLAFALGVGGYAYARRVQPIASPRQLPTPPQSSAEGHLPDAPSSSSVVTASPAAPARKTVLVRILPPTSSVDVDDKAATVVDGSVPIEGPLGSIHRVCVRQGRRAASANVVVSETGAVPALVALAPVKQPGSSQKPPPIPTIDPTFR